MISNPRKRWSTKETFASPFVLHRVFRADLNDRCDKHHRANLISWLAVLLADICLFGLTLTLTGIILFEKSYKKK